MSFTLAFFYNLIVQFVSKSVSHTFRKVMVSFREEADPVYMIYWQIRIKEVFERF